MRINFEFNKLKCSFFVFLFNHTIPSDAKSSSSGSIIAKVCEVQ